MALTPEEELELAQLEQQTGSQPQQRGQSGLSADEEAELADLELAEANKPGAGLDINFEEDTAGDIAFKGGLRALDVAGSPVRGALAAALEEASGKDLFKEGELQAALTGNFPSTDVILQRAGVPEGGKLSDIPGSDAFFSPKGTGGFFTPEVGGKLDFTARGTGGFAADIGTDPLTYISLGAAPILKKALRKALSKTADGGIKIVSKLAKAKTKLGRKLTPSETALVLNEEVVTAGARAVDDVATGPAIGGEIIEQAGPIQQQLPAPQPRELMSQAPELADDSIEASFKQIVEEGAGEAPIPKEPFSFTPDKESVISKLKTTARDTLDTGLQLAKDPIKFLGDTAGKKLHGSAFGKVDAILAEKGVKPLSKMLNKHGVKGDTKLIGKEIDRLAGDLSNEREALYKFVDEADITVDLDRVLQGTMDDVTDLLGSGVTPKREALVNEMQKVIESYSKNGSNISIQKASNLKTDLYDNLPDSAFKDGYRLTDDAKKIFKKMAKRLKDGIEESAEAAEAGLGSRVSDLNSDWGTLISAKKPVNRQIKTEAGKKGFTQVDAITAALAPQAFLAKQAAKVVSGTGFKTRVGRGLQNKALAPLTRAGTLTGTRGLPNEDN